MNSSIFVSRPRKVWRAPVQSSRVSLWFVYRFLCRSAHVAPKRTPSSCSHCACRRHLLRAQTYGAASRLTLSNPMANICSWIFTNKPAARGAKTTNKWIQLTRTPGVKEKNKLPQRDFVPLLVKGQSVEPDGGVGWWIDRQKNCIFRGTVSGRCAPLSVHRELMQCKDNLGVGFFSG